MLAWTRCPRCFGSESQESGRTDGSRRTGPEKFQIDEGIDGENRDGSCTGLLSSPVFQMTAH